MDMEQILSEIQQDVFERPKPTIDLDYLYSKRKEIQKYAQDTNSQLKKNVYQNYSLFIESSQEIETLKEEMRQLNSLLDQQQTSINKLLDQLSKTPIVQPALERCEPRNDLFGNLNHSEANDDYQSEMLPQWFVKSPEDFDVLIAQRNLREAVELAKRVREHFLEYPKCCESDRTDLKNKIEGRMKELVQKISSELQPSSNSIQLQLGCNSIQLLKELNLTSRAVKLYLDSRSLGLRFVLDQQKGESTLQFIKQLCSIFFNIAIETCNEFEKAFEEDKLPNLACWLTLELENFAAIFRKHVFKNSAPLSLSMIAESIYHLSGQCSRLKVYCDISMAQFVERELSNEIRRVIEDSGRKLIETIRKLDADERWQPQRFHNRAEKTRFLEDMTDVDLKTMPKYITESFELNFTASKTAFARCFLITVNDLAKLVMPSTKNHVDSVLAKAFEIQIQSVIDELGKSKVTSRSRFIKGNSNFLLDKVIVVANEKYTSIANEKCLKLLDLRAKYQAKADAVAKLQNV